MNTKLFEVRDTGTFTSVLAVQLGSHDEPERWLMTRAGYGRHHYEQKQYVWLAMIDGNEPGNGTYDPYKWPDSNRTMQVAHRHIIDHFEELESGAVVDVEHILGIRDTIKQSERINELK